MFIVHSSASSRERPLIGRKTEMAEERKKFAADRRRTRKQVCKRTEETSQKSRDSLET